MKVIRWITKEGKIKHIDASSGNIKQIIKTIRSTEGKNISIFSVDR